jgi:hypothetical protein
MSDKGAILLASSPVTVKKQDDNNDLINEQRIKIITTAGLTKVVENENN